jgi:hypothetical protein
MVIETVLFDLDGTVIDTGPLIANSFRYTKRSVLGVEIPDEELLRYVGSWGLRAQMERLAPERVDELVDVYRAHIEPLHAELEYCPIMSEAFGSDLSRPSGSRWFSSPSMLFRAWRVFSTDRDCGGDRAPQAEPRAPAARTGEARSSAGGRSLRRRLALRHRGGERGRPALDRGHLGRDPIRRASAGRRAGRDRGDPGRARGRAGSFSGLARG